MMAVVAVVLVSGYGNGCGKDKPAPPLSAPPPAAGYTRVAGSGFTIDMPAGWKQPPLDPGSFDQTAAALGSQNPQLVQALQQARATLGNGSRLFAIDPVDGSSVNLIVTAAGGRSLDALVADAVNQLRQVGVGSLQRELSTVGSRQAVRLQFSLSVRGQGGTLAVPEAQYYVLRDKRLFILTLFGSHPSLPAVAESLRIN
jgi:hypothetical protein